MRYSAIVRAVFSSVWAILPEKIEAICAFVQLKASGGTVDPGVIALIRAENAAAEARVKSLATGKPGSIAVLPLYGVINQRVSGDVSGPSGTSIQEFTQSLRQAVNDPNVSAIVIDVDSPGGTVSGVDELAAEIFNARKQKKITAVSNCLCASAAYWLASQASEVVASPSSMTGSIGVYQIHEDDSQALDQMGIKMSFVSAGKYKTEGNPYEPLDDAARGAMQSAVDDFYGLFTKAVARGRGVSVKSVVNGFGEGRVLTAQDAVKQGLADRVATFDDVLGKYGVKRPSTSASALRAEQPVNDPTEEEADDGCSCACEGCQAGDCSSCTHEACDAEAEDCEGCGMSASAEPGDLATPADPGDLSKAQAEARKRRLRLAAL